MREFGAIAVAVLLWSIVAYQHGYKKGVAEFEKALLDAHQSNEKKALDYAKTSAAYYELYQAELNREPATVTERVFVKAACPELPPDTTGSVGAGGDKEARAELHAETVARIAKVTHEAEQEVLLCRTALKSVIEKIQK